MKKSYVTAGVLAVLATLWIATGMIGKGSKTDEAKTSDIKTAQERQKVEVRTITAKMVSDSIDLNGKTEAARRVDLKAEIDGRVAEILIKEGEQVKAGQAIIKIDLRDRQAKLSSEQHTVTQKEIEYTAAEGLADKGFSSKVRVEEARAGLEAARARLKTAQIELANTQIKAPFDGVLETRPAELGQYLTPGLTVGTVVDLDPVFVVASVSEQQVGRLAAGGQALVTLPDGRQFKGIVSYIASSAEATTRTFKVKVEVQNPDRQIIEGLTAQVSLLLPERPAHEISSSMFSLADDGQLGVKAVDDANKVVFYPVTVLANKRDVTLVSGLPQSLRAIVTGQEYAGVGQEVVPVENNSGAAP